MLWLPVGINHELINRFFDYHHIGPNYIKAIDPEHQSVDLGDTKASIETGVLRVKLTVKTESAVEFLNHIRSNVIGRGRIGGHNAFITKVGDPISCFYCHCAGHTRTDCPKKAQDDLGRKTYASQAAKDTVVDQVDEVPIELDIQATTANR